MQISQQILDELKKFEARTVEVNESVLYGIIPRLKTIFPQICGRILDKNFFYRQTTWFEDFARRNILARFFDLTAAVYFAEVARGELLIQFVESFFAYLRATKAAQPVQVDFWEFEKETSDLRSVRIAAVARGNKQIAREVTEKIKNNETAMPIFLKRAQARRRARRQKEKTNAVN